MKISRRRHDDWKQTKHTRTTKNREWRDPNNNINIMANNKYHWTRRLRSVLSSISDLVGDWTYYQFVLDLDDARIDEKFFGNAMFAACIASTIFGALSIWTVGFGREQPLQCCKECICGLTPGKMAHLLETLFEDIPQL